MDRRLEDEPAEGGGGGRCPPWQAGGRIQQPALGVREVGRGVLQGLPHEPLGVLNRGGALGGSRGAGVSPRGTIALDTPWGESHFCWTDSIWEISRRNAA